ncbi:helix-turn-helix domain-containing protein [Nocardia sp. NPDC006630]|uniref:PucR family transcriptional regulator n=1 Tax=Nocardia sp. NPDC006630 TaxID=3157181 RepID=UPI0033B2228D
MTSDSFVAAACHALLENIDALVDEVAREIMHTEPAYGTTGPIAADDLRRNNRENLQGVLSHLAGHPSPGTASAESTGRLRAQQRIPLPVVLRAYRIGTRVTWDRMVAMAAGDPEAGENLLARASDIWRLVDDYSQALTAGYVEAITEQNRRDARARAAALEALLAGEAESAARLRACADAVRLPVSGTYAVICATTESAVPEPIPGVAAALTALGVRAAWRTRLDTHVGIVALTESFPIERLTGLLRERAEDTIGISPVFTDLTYAHAALRKAELACAAADPECDPVLRYEHGLFGILIVSAPDLAAALVTQVLGPMLTLPEHDRASLLDTLSAWFRLGGNITALSETLYVHRNTVRFRLNRIAELTGLRVSEPAQAAELYLALRAHRTLPNS